MTGPQLGVLSSRQERKSRTALAGGDPARAAGGHFQACSGDGVMVPGSTRVRDS